MKSKPSRSTRKPRSIRKTLRTPYQPWNIQRHFFRQSTPLPTRLALIKAEDSRQKLEAVAPSGIRNSQAKETTTGASSPLRGAEGLYWPKELRRWKMRDLVLSAWRRQHGRREARSITSHNHMGPLGSRMAEMESSSGSQSIVGRNTLLTDNIREDRESGSSPKFVSAKILLSF
jgi:hypothetical protein